MNIKNINPAQIKKELKIVLDELHPDVSGIRAIYLFGSTLTDSVKTESDLDLAFLLEEKAHKADQVAAEAPAYLVATRFGMKLDKETDVTVLNSASLEMAYEIVTSGLCLFEADMEKRLEYEATLRGMYFDFKPFLDDLRSNCLSRL